MRYLFLAAFTLFLSTNAATVSRNARCGQGFGTICLNSKYGSCCSQYGWCGSTSDYCGTGCQSGFGTCNDRSSSSDSSSSVRASSTPARSQTSFIRSQTSITRSQTTFTRSPMPSATQKVSQNARCGDSFGGQTCQGSQWGDCCSQYYYCGRTPDYCGPKSCQAKFGRCVAASSFSRSSSRSSTATSRSATQSTSRTLSSSSSSVVASSTTSLISTQSSSNVASISSVSTPTPSSITSSTFSSTPEPTPEPTPSSTPESISFSTPEPTPSSTPEPTPTPTSTPEPIATQLILNPSFELGFPPWRLQGSYAIDTANSFVQAGESRTGTNAFRATGNTFEWFLDITQTLALVPNTGYQLEMWAKSATAGCTVVYQFLGKSDSFDLGTEYTRSTLRIAAADVTAQVIAQTESSVLIDMFCNAGFGTDYTIFLDDVTVTVQ